MKEIIHFTSHYNWRKIKDDGVLLPKTSLRKSLGDFEISPLLAKIITQDQYVVGIPQNLIKGWKKYDLFKSLLTHVGSRVALKIPVLEIEGAFVREHALFSPKRLREEENIDLSDLTALEESRIRFKVQNDHFLDYLDSTVRLADYEDTYNAPEVWLPQKTPFSLIKRYFFFNFFH